MFSRAALEYLRLRGRRPSVIHAHDWQAGLVPAYQKMLFSPDPVVGGVPVVFTIHNLAFQGIFPVGTLDEIGLPRDVLHVEAMEFYGRISFLKAGINFSERITTVSPTYAREILERQNGFGFEGVLARRAEDLRGILNGIDVDRWNPATDAFLPARYSADDLAGKAEVKRFLLEACRSRRLAGSARAPAHRAGLAADRSEGLRPHRRRRRRADDAGCGVGHARKRRADAMRSNGRCSRRASRIV